MEGQKIISVLCSSFDSNRSVNYAIKQDAKRKLRLRNLIAYSFEVAKRKGEVFLDETQTTAALITFSDKKINFATQTIHDLQLIATSIGLSGVRKVLAREKYINSYHPKTKYIYLWFIGVGIGSERKGFGSMTLRKIIEKSESLKMPVYLETSMPENIPFYTKNGFEVYHEANINACGFVTYFMRREIGG